MSEITEDSLLIVGPRRGRPTRAESPTSVASVRLSPAERERVKMAARANHQTISDFARDALVTAAEDCLEAPHS